MYVITITIPKKEKFKFHRYSIYSVTIFSWFVRFWISKFRILKSADLRTASSELFSDLTFSELEKCLCDYRIQDWPLVNLKSACATTGYRTDLWEFQKCLWDYGIQNWPLVNLRSACATTGYRTPINSSRSISPSLLESPRVNKASISWTQIRSIAENHVFWHNLEKSNNF